MKTIWKNNKNTYLAEFFMTFIFAAVFSSVSDSLWGIAFSFFLSILIVAVSLIYDLICKYDRKKHNGS